MILSKLMSVFIGGSAFAMVRDIAEGYIIIAENTFKKFHPGELAAFQFEVEKQLRELRSEAVGASDLDAIQRKNRKLQRLQQSITIANSFRQKYKR
jgi:hypothetical protein